MEKSLNSIIKLGKDFTEKWQQTNIVYSFKCHNCPAIYIGETKRSLKTRINEHKNNKNSESVLFRHQAEFNHEFDWEHVKIIDYESDYKKRLTSEMIHIKCNKFSINKKEDIFTLNRIYFPLLKLLDS